MSIDDLTSNEQIKKEYNLEELIELGVKANNLLTTYLNVAKAVSENFYLDAKKVLGGNNNLSSQLNEVLLQISQQIHLTALEKTVQDAARIAQLHYQENLEGKFVEAKIDYSGTIPDYTIANVLKLHIDLRKGSSTLEGKRLQSIEPNKLVELLKRRITELLERPFNSNEFLLMLENAYEEVVSTQGISVGEYADIRVIATSMNNKMRLVGDDPNYSNDKFSIDLYRLCIDGRPSTSKGMILEFSPAQSASGGLFIAARNGGNYVAAIRFVKGAEHA